MNELHKVINPFIYNECERLHTSNPDIRPFLEPSYAQRYEDVIIYSLLRAAGSKVKKPLCYGYLEIGANHPISTSSTYLLTKMGASGILVEPNPKLAKELKKIRTHCSDLIIEAACVAGNAEEIEIAINNDESELSSSDPRFTNKNHSYSRVMVQAININVLLEMMDHNYDIYSLFIDVEGPDAEILEAINYEKYRPITIQIEASDAVIPGNANRITDFMKSQGYVFIASTDINLIFIDGERL